MGLFQVGDRWLQQDQAEARSRFFFHIVVALESLGFFICYWRLPVIFWKISLTTFCILETAVRSLHFLPSTHGCDHFFPVLKVMNTFDVGGSLFGDFMI